MLHGPTSDDYWSAPLRVLAVNMESYGYDECGHWEVDLNCLLDWMYDRGETGTRTVRYTLAIVRCLTEALSVGTPPSPAALSAAYEDAPALEAVVRSIVYYNIRPTANPHKNQDVASIIASGTGMLAGLARDEMLALEPRVVLVSGLAGLAAFNAMWRLDPELPFRGRRWFSDRMLIQSFKHPARPDYQEYATMIADLARELKAGL